MSGYANISAVPDNRILYDAASGATLLSNQRNQLLNQETAALMPYKVQEAQQQVGAADMAAVGQASQGLLTNYPDEASRAAAYPGIVADLQRQGFAKNAPSAYPGEVALKQLAGYAIPLAKQYELGIMVPPGLAKALGGDQTPGAASGGTDPVSGMPVDKALPVLEQRESGGRNIPTQIKNPDGTPASTASGYYQMLDSTFQEGMKLAGIPGTWTRAMDAPREVQTAAANAIYQKYGAAPWAASNPNRRAQTAATPAAPGASQTAAATPQVQIGGAPPAPPGAPPGTSAPIGQGISAVLSPRAGPIPVGRTPGQRTADIIQQGMQQAQATPAGGVLAAGGNVVPTATPATATAPAEPPWTATPGAGALSYSDSPTIPQAAPNALAPGGAKGPPAPTQPPAAPQAQAGAPAQIPGTGINSPQYQQFQAIQRQIDQLMPYAALPAAKAKIAQLQGQQQVLMQMDSVVTLPDGRQVHTLTGKIESAAKPALNYTESSPGVYTSPGAEPKFAPPGRPVTGVGPDPNDPTRQIPGHWVTQAGRSTFYPEGTQPATAAYDQQAKAYSDDRTRMPAISESAQTAQNGMIRLNELANIIPQLATGPAGELRTKGAAWLEALGASPATIKAYTGMESGSLAEELIKLSVATVGQAAKADLGSHVGIQSLQLYQSANPGMALLPDANKRMTNMARVAAQMTQDYAAGAQQHFNDNQGSFLKPGGSYLHPLSEYDQHWQQQNNPHIGSAAMGILNGDSFDKWALRVTPEEAKQAVAVAYRIDPTTMVPTSKGMKPAAEILGAKSGQ